MRFEYDNDKALDKSDFFKEKIWLNFHRKFFSVITLNMIKENFSIQHNDR